MAVIQISKMLARRGVRADLPTQLSEGEVGLAVDTGEIFMGVPNLTSVPYVTPTPRARGDQNVRILTELDTVGENETFTDITLPVGSSSVALVSFPSGNVFAIVDYGLLDATTGPLISSTMWISGNTFHDNPWASSAVTFSMATANSIGTLSAINNSQHVIIVSISVRSWGNHDLSNEPTLTITPPVITNNTPSLTLSNATLVLVSS